MGPAPYQANHKIRNCCHHCILCDQHYFELYIIPNPFSFYLFFADFVIKFKFLHLHHNALHRSQESYRKWDFSTHCFHHLTLSSNDFIPTFTPAYPTGLFSTVFSPVGFYRLLQWLYSNAYTAISNMAFLQCVF